MGRVLSFENTIRGADLVVRWGRQHSGRALARARRGPRVVADPAHAKRLHAREPADLRTVCSREGSRPAREGELPHDWRERGGGVGPRRSTNEPTEQGRGIDPACGGWGGKGADQGEHRAGPHAPDIGRGKARVPGTGWCAPSRRHAPGVGAVCVSGARTDLCGGRSGMTVSTATHFFWTGRTSGCRTGRLCNPMRNWLR